MRSVPSEMVRAEILSLLAAGRQLADEFVIVGQEVGFGLTPITPLGRRFIDLQGLASQIVAAEAEEVFLMVTGLPLKLKG